jgi:hypothetical protein
VLGVIAGCTVEKNAGPSEPGSSMTIFTNFSILYATSILTKYVQA